MVQRFAGALLVILALSLSAPKQAQAASSLCFSPTSGSCFDFSGLGLGGTSSYSWELGSLNSWLDDLIDDLSEWLGIDLTPYLPPATTPENTVGVPDPASWILLLTGIAGVGVVAWKRRRVSA